MSKQGNQQTPEDGQGQTQPSNTDEVWSKFDSRISKVESAVERMAALFLDTTRNPDHVMTTRGKKRAAEQAKTRIYQPDPALPQHKTIRLVFQMFLSWTLMQNCRLRWTIHGSTWHVSLTQSELQGMPPTTNSPHFTRPAILTQFHL